MTPEPTAIALTICDQVIVDERTKKPSIIGMFTGLGVEQFPSDPQRFSVCASLTGGVGDGRIELSVSQASTGETIYQQAGTIHFPDRTDMVNVFFRIRKLRFPAPGFYLFRL